MSFPVHTPSLAHVVLLWLCTAVAVCGWSQLDCPVTVSSCDCTTTYTTNHHIYCEYMGQVNTLPDFGISNVTFVDLHVRYQSAVHTLKNDHFENVTVSRLYLIGLGIREIQPRAFSYLENVMTELHLDINFISFFLENVFAHNKLSYLGLSNNLLSQYPPNGNIINIPNLSDISLFNNRIRKLTSTAFQGTQALNVIRLNNNLLRELPHDVFYNLVYLRDLQLANNSISELQTDLFADLISLLKLDLSYNNLSTLHQETFDSLVNLTHCRLSHNKISSLSSLLNIGRKLTFLDLSYNRLLGVDGYALNNMTKLQILDLSHNRIYTVSESALENLFSLRKLFMGYNRLHSIDHVKGSFPRLWTLDIARNVLQVIQNRTFERMVNLRVLALDNNNISDIYPGTFQRLSNLTTLDLSNNGLTRVTGSLFSNHSRLQTVFLNNNSISVLEDGCFQNLTHLLGLHLQYNEISTLPIYVFNGTTRLRTLQLSHNKFGKEHRLDRWMFEGLHSLESLYLDHNELLEIPHRSFERMSGSLTHLYLQNNDVVYLYYGSLGALENLLLLNVSNNDLSGISQGAFSALGNLKILDIHGNRLSSVRWSILEDLISVEHVDLSHNMFRKLPDRYILERWSKLLTLKLVGNNFNCGRCNLACLRSLNISVLVDIHSIECKNPTSLTGWNVICFPLPVCQCPPISSSVLQFCSPTTRVPPAVTLPHVTPPSSTVTHVSRPTETTTEKYLWETKQDTINNLYFTNLDQTSGYSTEGYVQLSSQYQNPTTFDQPSPTSTTTVTSPLTQLLDTTEYPASTNYVDVIKRTMPQIYDISRSSTETSQNDAAGSGPTINQEASLTSTNTADSIIREITSPSNIHVSGSETSTLPVQYSTQDDSISYLSDGNKTSLFRNFTTNGMNDYHHSNIPNDNQEVIQTTASRDDVDVNSSTTMRTVVDVHSAEDSFSSDNDTDVISQSQQAMSTSGHMAGGGRIVYRETSPILSAIAAPPPRHQLPLPVVPNGHTENDYINGDAKSSSTPSPSLEEHASPVVPGNFSTTFANHSPNDGYDLTTNTSEYTSRDRDQGITTSGYIQTNATDEVTVKLTENIMTGNEAYSTGSLEDGFNESNTGGIFTEMNISEPVTTDPFLVVSTLPSHIASADDTSNIGEIAEDPPKEVNFTHTPTEGSVEIEMSTMSRYEDTRENDLGYNLTTGTVGQALGNDGGPSTADYVSQMGNAGHIVTYTVELDNSTSREIGVSDETDLQANTTIDNGISTAATTMVGNTAYNRNDNNTAHDISMITSMNSVSNKGELPQSTKSYTGTEMSTMPSSEGTYENNLDYKHTTDSVEHTIVNGGEPTTKDNLFEMIHNTNPMVPSSSELNHSTIGQIDVSDETDLQGNTTNENDIITTTVPVTGHISYNSAGSNTIHDHSRITSIHTVSDKGQSPQSTTNPRDTSSIDYPVVDNLMETTSSIITSVKSTTAADSVYPSDSNGDFVSTTEDQSSIHDDDILMENTTFEENVDQFSRPTTEKGYDTIHVTDYINMGTQAIQGEQEYTNSESSSNGYHNSAKHSILMTTLTSATHRYDPTAIAANPTDSPPSDVPVNVMSTSISVKTITTSSPTQFTNYEREIPQTDLSIANDVITQPVPTSTVPNRSTPIIIGGQSTPDYSNLSSPGHKMDPDDTGVDNVNTTAQSTAMHTDIGLASTDDLVSTGNVPLSQAEQGFSTKETHITDSNNVQTTDTYDRNEYNHNESAIDTATHSYESAESTVAHRDHTVPTNHSETHVPNTNATTKSNYRLFAPSSAFLTVTDQTNRENQSIHTANSPNTDVMTKLAAVRQTTEPTPMSPLPNRSDSHNKTSSISDEGEGNEMTTISPSPVQKEEDTSPNIS